MIAHRPFEVSAVRRAVYVAALAMASLAATSSAMWSPRGDWEFFRGVSRALTGADGLHVYARHANTQTGPISLLLFRIFTTQALDHKLLYATLFAALGWATVYALWRARQIIQPDTANRLDPTALLASVGLLFWWSFLQVTGHLDDAVVLTIAAFAMLLIVRRRTVPAAVLLGLTLAVKPWAVFLVPLTIDREQPTWRQRLKHPMASLVVGGAFWLPFVLADRGTLDGLQPTVRLARDSVLRLFGAEPADITSTLRIAQLAVAVGVASIGAWRGRWAAGVLGGFGVRLLLDPGTWSYYTPGFVFAAVAWDLLASRSRFPLATAAATVLLAPPWVVADVGLRARYRLIVCAAAIVVALWPWRRAQAVAAVEHGEELREGAPQAFVKTLSPAV